MYDIIKAIETERNPKRWRKAVYALNLPENRGKRHLLLELLLRKNKKVLLRAIKAAGMLGLRIAASRLAYYLNTGEAKVRLAAAKALKTCATREELDVMGEALADPVVEVGIELSLAIAHQGGLAALHILRRAARSEDPVVAMHGLFGIENIRDRKCKRHLLVYLEREDTQDLRAVVASALAAMGTDDRVKKCIEEAMLREEDDLCQLELASALLKLGKDVLWMVLPRMKSPDPALRQTAAAAAGLHFSKDSVGLLQGMMQNDPYIAARKAARDSLAKFYRARKIRITGIREKFPTYSEMTKNMEYKNDHYSIERVIEDKDV